MSVSTNAFKPERLFADVRQQHYRQVSAALLTNVGKAADDGQQICRRWSVNLLTFVDSMNRLSLSVDNP